MYCSYLASAGVALAFGALALGEGSHLLLLRALAASGIALLLRHRLASTGNLAACAEEDDCPVSRLGLNEPEADSLRTALAAMVRLRGTRAFDPWKYQELRQKLETRSDPNVRRSSAASGPPRQHPFP